MLRAGEARRTGNETLGSFVLFHAVDQKLLRRGVCRHPGPGKMDCVAVLGHRHDDLTEAVVSYREDLWRARARQLYGFDQGFMEGQAIPGWRQGE